MRCVICKKGRITQGKVQAEIKIGPDHLLVQVEAEVCKECGEAYYSTESMRYLDQVRDNFVHKVITPPTVGHVYQIL